MQRAILLSGGVDSAVAALLMKERGFDVEGFCMTTDYFSSDVEKRAKNIASCLGIKLNIIDVSEEFKKRVIDYFENEYQNLRTPNPCVMCNKWIKFGMLYDKVRDFGFEIIATGHYIKKTQDADKIQNLKSQNNEPRASGYRLQAAADKKKDQGYFLYNLTQEHLKHLEFPLGGLTKDEVWKIAKKNNLPISEGESQDICFLKGDHNNYLQKHIRLEKGPIIDKEGKILGEHFGLPLYAVGQRRWIKIGGTGPYYVLRSDIKLNTLFVTDKFDDPEMYRDEFCVEEVNWINSKYEICNHKTGLVAQKLELDVKIRYLHPAAALQSIEEIGDGKYKAILKDKQRAITPGQSAVFYAKDGELLGGGIIN